MGHELYLMDVGVGPLHERQRTPKQIEAEWQKVLSQVDINGSGRQDHHSVVWIRLTPAKHTVAATFYAFPAFPGFFDFPVPKGATVRAVQKYLAPILRDGFVYAGYST